MLASIKNCKKTQFWQFKDHNSGRRHEKQTNDPIFFICVSSPSCLGNSFLYLGIVKIHFHGILSLVNTFFSGLQNTSILQVKVVVRSGFCSVWFRKHIHWGKVKKKTGFIYIFYWVENKFQNAHGLNYFRM